VSQFRGEKVFKHTIRGYIFTCIVSSMDPSEEGIRLSADQCIGIRQFLR